MRRKPRDPNEPLLTRDMITYIIVFGVLNAIGCIFLFLWSINFNFAIDITTIDLTRQRTIIFAALVIFQTILCLSVSQKTTIFSKTILQNKILIAAVLLAIILLLSAIYVPFLQIFIRTYALGPIDWLMILITTIPIVMFAEFYEKYLLKPKIDKIDQQNIKSC